VVGLLHAPPVAVVLDGEIDIATVPAIHDHLKAVIYDGQGQLVIDMSAVSFIDASGLGMLVAAAKALQQAGGGLSLRSPSWQVQRLLDVLNLNGVLPSVR
jgi:anti-anti-sigma factor